MYRIVWMALLVSCGSESTKTSPPLATGVPRDAALADAVSVSPADAMDIVAWLDGLPPKGAAPAALIRKHRRGDCSTEYAPRPDRDPNPMCRVTGGTFMMGGHLDPSLHPVFSSADPPVQVTVGDFDIDQFEVTARQAAHFLNAHGNDCDGQPCTRFNENSEIVEQGGKYVPREGRDLDGALFYPGGALRYCAWVGKAVPSSAEYEYAARHDPKTGRDLVFPWGDQWDGTRAHCPSDICAGGGHVVGVHDGTRGRGDGSSPWGLHDAIDKMGEHVYSCLDVNHRCDVAGPCSCTWLSTTGGQADALAHATYARVNVTMSAVRCVRRR